MLPLADQSILVTRAATQAPTFSQALRQAGATVWEMPTLEIGPPSSWDALDHALDILDSFDWLILTSTNGVEAVWSRMRGLGIDPAKLTPLKIAVVGQKTAQSLQAYGRTPDFIPPQFIADALVEHFPESMTGLKILFPRVETGGREMLVQAMTDAGAKIVEVAAYESRCPHQIAPEIAELLQAKTLTMITFTSGKTVQHFCQLVGGVEIAQALLERVKLASIGPQTSQACRKYFGRVEIEAAEHTLEGLVRAILTEGGQG
ncbi:uroporphyrinogen-III synthase [Thermosynechococcaceae cyanobacterium BACA0444]|uniref:Uroporphyrinogen-III synthase n=1 Tax=Pseudocalidococcus azoricus BACA0444 TaxID=2918990 RepID=A0AAE4FW86_9CYAN|nr:uroporphyrinogen-III synthase [Pseudocalidococcus azoricus]MDS3862464.1 uroporphyrinogen-III synthase [Pseudocalidococcus azoricus BACA0444]